MASWTPSPVFIYECMAAARRWQTYAGRVVVLGAMLISLMVVWIIRVPTHAGPLTLNDLGRVGESFFAAIVGTQLVLALLAAPAYLSASICLDKARGTLTHMLVTDLSATEIVLGKLGARALPVFGMLMAGVPVLVLATLLGGIEPWAVVFSFFVIAGTTLVACALALALSVWGTKPHEVLLGTYLVEGIWLLAWPAWRGFIVTPPPPDWLQIMDPFRLLFGSVVWDDFGRFGECAVFVGICIGLSAALTTFAILTLRLAARRGGVRAPSRWRLPRMPVFTPKLDWNPVLWHEWRRRTPSRWLQVIWGIYTVGSLGASVIALLIGSNRGELAAFVNAFQFSIGLLLVSITSVATLFDERVNGSLDVLLTTPLTTGQIVWGKWLAGFRVVVLVMLLPILLAIGVHLWHGKSLGLGTLLLLIFLMFAYGALVNSVGLALATWISRFGVAMGLSVAIYVLLAAGPVLLLFTASGHGPDMEGFACLSPWYGVGLSTFELASRDEDLHFGWKLIWLLSYTLAALIVVYATRYTFDRCLGRAGRGSWRNLAKIDLRVLEPGVHNNSERQ